MFGEHRQYDRQAELGAKYREEVGSLLFPKYQYTQADFLFVPTRFSEEFAEAADLHLQHGVYLECAVPKIIDMVRQQSKGEAQVRVVELCTCRGGRRGRPALMINDICKPHGKFGIAHPVKISGSHQVFSEQMDSIQF